MSTVCPFIVTCSHRKRKGGRSYNVQAWIYTPRQASGGCKQNALLYSASVKREKVHHVIDRVAFYVT